METAQQMLNCDTQPRRILVGARTSILLLSFGRLTPKPALDVVSSAAKTSTKFAWRYAQPGRDSAYCQLLKVTGYILGAKFLSRLFWELADLQEQEYGYISHNQPLSLGISKYLGKLHPDKCPDESAMLVLGAATWSRRLSYDLAPGCRGPGES
ncbi:uncharacterized protein RCO7_14578 [Rhynchosporium graminicola]|uniref:Uncharacterized protein n=1 Tax=Rhynchosporium graminicola TaxID=2792576 RepID=A0A1E1KPV4_9HELO|nr:uncharacterized protein RCO7_14578 [Rhynchosporium commune]